MSKKRRGMTAVELVIVLAIIAILVAIAIPGFLKARSTAGVCACAENLAKIAGAKSSWSLDNNVAAGTSVTLATLVSTTGKYLLREPVCPVGGVYSINRIGEAPTCSLGQDGSCPTHVFPKIQESNKK